MSTSLSHREIAQNAAQMWNFSHGPLVARGNNLETIGPLWCPFIGKILFLIRDWWSCGSETQKVHDLVLETLKSMDNQVKTDHPHWHFSVVRYGFDQPIPHYYTYSMLAEKISVNSLFKDDPKIGQAIKNLQVDFDKIDFTQGLSGLTKEDVLYYMMSGIQIRIEGLPFRPLDGPSVQRVELEHLLQDKNKGLYFSVSSQRLRQIIDHQIASD